MAVTRIVTGTLMIPTTEANASGLYTDLRLELVFITSGSTVVDQTSTVSTSKHYTFTYSDNGQHVKVLLVVFWCNSLTHHDASACMVLSSNVEAPTISTRCRLRRLSSINTPVPQSSFPYPRSL
jgi:hypothetical protein